jgi:DNA invertase Pin-like site-specific DNA recombinase
MVQLEDSEINYIDADSPNDTDTIKAIKFSLAKEKHQNISDNTRKALQEKKAQGFKLGSPKNLTDQGRKRGNEGNKRKALNNPNNIRAAAFAQTLKEQGLNYSEIARLLNQNGFQSSRGCKIHSFQVKRIIEMFA